MCGLLRCGLTGLQDGFPLCSLSRCLPIIGRAQPQAALRAQFSQQYSRDAGCVEVG
jgi:hypothetical protein